MTITVDIVEDLRNLPLQQPEPVIDVDRVSVTLSYLVGNDDIIYVHFPGAEGSAPAAAISESTHFGWWLSTDTWDGLISDLHAKYPEALRAHITEAVRDFRRHVTQFGWIVRLIILAGGTE